MAVSLPQVGIRLRVDGGQQAASAIRGIGTQLDAVNPRAQNAARQMNRLTTATGDLTSVSKRSLTALNGVAFAFSQFAYAGETSIRSLAMQVTGVMSLMGRWGAVTSIISTGVLSVIDVISAAQKRRLEEMQTLREAGIRNTGIAEKAAIDDQESRERTAFDRSLSSLKEYYDDRGKLIAARTAQEAKELNAQAAHMEQKAAEIMAYTTRFWKSMPDFLKADALKQGTDLTTQASTLRAQARAAQTRGGGAQAQNETERIAAERSVAEAVMRYEQQIMEARGDTHRARLQQITVEADSYRRELVKQGVTEDEIAKRMSAFTASQQTQVQLAELMAVATRSLAELERQREQIQQDLAAGKITEWEANERIRQSAEALLSASVSGYGSLTQHLAKALALANALGNPETIAAIKQLQVTIGGLGVDTNMVNLERQIHDTLVGTLSNAISSGFADGINASSVANAFTEMTASILQQLGTAAISIGIKVGAIAKLLAAARKWMVANPIAAIAIGATLVALGAAMGGRRGGGGSAGASGGGASTASRPDVTRIFVADGAARPRTAGVGGMTGMPAPLVFPLMNPADPASQRLIAQAQKNAMQRGF